MENQPTGINPENKKIIDLPEKYFQRDIIKPALLSLMDFLDGKDAQKLVERMIEEFRKTEINEDFEDRVNKTIKAIINSDAIPNNDAGPKIERILHEVCRQMIADSLDQELISNGVDQDGKILQFPNKPQLLL